MSQTPPRWDLSNIYASLDDPQLQADMQAVIAQTQQLAEFYQSELLPLAEKDLPSSEALAQRLNKLIDELNTLLEKASTIGSFLFLNISTNSFDKQAEQLLSRFQIDMVPLDNLLVQLRKWLGKVQRALPEALQQPGSANQHAFFLLEEAEQSRYLMSEAEEMLANELTLSGGTAWGQLQGVLTSQKTAEFELEGKMQQLPMPALINLRTHPSAEVRERAYQTELTVWEELKEPLAACLNGVKGESITLDKKRGRRDSLHASLDLSRIDEDTLEAMFSAVRASLPTFRRYFQGKANYLGMPQLPWWSLLAPLGKSTQTYSFTEARELILTYFGSFSPELANFAHTAFAKNWIDAEQRPGKRGGAFCDSIPGVKESRVLCNFDGSLDQVFTLAHELGHGFHDYCAYKAGKTPLQTRTPMTLAETASIMCETIVFNAIHKTISDPQEELAILETNLSSSAEVVVDIYSRFLFEKEVFARRAKSTLAADEISEVMLWAQREAYGDGLDPNVLHKYMWTWKPHYYNTQFAFYNYPYTFGLLFATGLYAIYAQRGAEFVPEYMQLLASTGEAKPVDLAARFGINIRDQAFWQSSLDVLGSRIERYLSLGQ